MVDVKTYTDRVLDAIELTRGTGRGKSIGEINISAASRFLGVSRSTVARDYARIKDVGVVDKSERYIQSSWEKMSSVSPRDVSQTLADVVKTKMEQTGGSFKSVAKEIGTTPQQVGKFWKKIQRGETGSLVRTTRTAKRARERALQAPRPFEGKNPAKLQFEIEGKNYRIRDYKYGENFFLPDQRERSRYQVIIKGKDKQGNKRTFTTTIYGTPQEAMGAAGAMMKGYKGASGDEVIIRQFDYEWYGDPGSYPAV